jgi:hypothetical protein
VYDNEQAGVNGNFRSIQFVRTAAAFGGGAPRSAADELAPTAGDAGHSENSSTNEPW